MPMELNNHTRQYWTEKDLIELEQTEDMPQMLAIGLRVLKRMPQPVGQVCGPISTGGRGSILANLIAFNEAIVFLQAEGKHVFDQMPFEQPMGRVKAQVPDGEYATMLLTDFYQPLFETGLIKIFYFLPDWESSVGACWEHNQALKLGIEIVYLK